MIFPALLEAISSDEKMEYTTSHGAWGFSQKSENLLLSYYAICYNNKMHNYMNYRETRAT